MTEKAKNSRVQSLEPSPEALRRMKFKHGFLSKVFRAGASTFAQLTAEGTEAVPSEGPLVVLGNHTCALDAPGINVLLGRPVIFLGTAALMGNGFRASFLGGIGVIPKKKFMSDARAVRALKGWVDSGAAVGVFPEGERSWDGGPLPFVPGIEKLVRLLGAPVVTTRIHNGDRVWPRWATSRRKGRVHFEFDAPVQFERRAPLDEVLGYIRDRTVLSPEETRRWEVTGKDLALGLPNLVYACPACGGLESMLASKNNLACSSCETSWKLDPTNTLTHAQEGYTLTVATAAQSARHQLFTAMQEVEHAGGGERVLLESQDIELLDQSGDEPATIGQGRLQLTSDCLRLVDSSVQWSLPLSEIRSVSMEMTRRLWLMTSDAIFEPVFADESSIKWCDAIKATKRG
ncbi:MAG: lysophospholipid acyltransferase family protein [Myxococcota bacterium]|nr:lysophospholipid acyltransferase family protein [Myxococcota bacterium]